MTHSAPMADSEGQFGDYRPEPETACRACSKREVSCRVWESSCGGYEDYHFRCRACGHAWWVDGIDS